MNTQNSLNLIADNYSESENEDEPCIKSTKHAIEDDLTQSKPAKKSKVNERPSRLPLPSIFMKTEAPAIDNADDHDGRIRSFAHERGNWATHVYIHYNNRELMEEICSAAIHQSTYDLKPIKDFHVSLSKTVVLKHHWIEMFVDYMKELIGKNDLKRFTVTLGDMEVYCNEEKTRTFLGVKILGGHDQLVRAVETVDQCFRKFALDTFYADPSFHISIAWCLGDKKDQIKKEIDQLNRIMFAIIDKQTDDWNVNVDGFYCKIGNKIFQWNLA